MNQTSCKSNSGFGFAMLKEIGIAKGVAQPVQFAQVHRAANHQSRAN